MTPRALCDTLEFLAGDRQLRIMDLELRERALDLNPAATQHQQPKGRPQHNHDQHQSRSARFKAKGATHKVDASKAVERQNFMAPFLEKSTLSAISKRSGVIHSSLYRWNKGELSLSVENRNKLAVELKVELGKIPN
jgi:hypothetical protein